MNGSRRWHAFTAVLATLGLAVLACSPSFGLGAPTPPASPSPVSSEAAGQVDGLWATAVAGANDGQVTLVVTEAQLTS